MSVRIIIIIIIIIIITTIIITIIIITIIIITRHTRNENIQQKRLIKHTYKTTTNKHVVHPVATQ